MPIHRFVLQNGRIRESSDPSLTPGQLGLLSGWGVFSTLRVEDGVLFAWDRHWSRMTRDAELLNVAIPDSSGEVHAALLRLVDANRARTSTLRIAVVRNRGGMWEGPSSGHVSDIIGLTADRNHWSESVRLKYQPEARHSASDFTRAKMLSWCGNLRWYERAHEEGFDECVLLNERREVCECTSANIFAVHGNTVTTPPLAAGCLPGITREILLSEIRVPGLTLLEKTLQPADLENADEVFITSTTRDLLPVSLIGQRSFPLDGRVRRDLQHAFRQYLAAYVASHRESQVPVG